MYIVVDFRMEKRQLDVPSNSTIEDIVRELDCLPDSCIALISGVPVPMTETPKEGSVIKLVRVASGG